MANSEWMNTVVLGVGGNRPGLSLLRPGGQHPERLLELPLGQSVYTIDLNLADGLVAAGNRAGAIDVTTFAAAGGIERTLGRQTLIQGSPVLAVCLLGDGQLASSDHAGRCFLWRMNGTAVPSRRSLETQAHRICALAPLPNDRLAGLAADGMVLFWSASDGKLHDSVPGPKPPRKLALVHLRYWLEADLLVYPATDGCLVLVEPQSGHVQACLAHRSEFYATVPLGQQLLTVGLDDGQLRIWPHPGRQGQEGIAPAATLPAPRGVIAGEVLYGGDSPQLLLLSLDGRGAVYQMEAAGLRRVAQLAGCDYRTIGTVAELQRQAIMQQQRQDEARELEMQARESIASGRWSDIDHSCQRLAAMGCAAQALELRTQAAHAQEDLVAELVALHQSVAVAKSETRHVPEPSLARYGELLQCVGQFAEAGRLLTRYPALPGHATTMNRLRRIARILGKSEGLIQPALPPSSAPREEHVVALSIRAATAIGQPFVGRWILERFDLPTLSTAHLSAPDIAAKYEEVRAETSGKRIPRAAAHRPWRIDAQQMEQIELVLIDGPEDPAIEPLRIGIQVQHNGLQTLLTAMLLLDAGRNVGKGSVTQHNQQIQDSLEAIRHGKLAASWITCVDRVIQHTLRRLHGVAATYKRPCAERQRI